MSSYPESGPADERELRTQWNAELAEAGTPRHVIPALARFVDGTDLPDTEITVLTAGIQRSALWKRHVGAITANHAWVCRMDASGAIWTIISSRCDTLPLPSPPRTDPARPWRIFPKLDSEQSPRRVSTWSLRRSRLLCFQIQRSQFRLAMAKRYFTCSRASRGHSATLRHGWRSSRKLETLMTISRPREAFAISSTRTRNIIGTTIHCG